MMTRYKPSWVDIARLGRGPRYPEHPKLSIAAWHERHGMTGASAGATRKRRRARR